MRARNKSKMNSATNAFLNFEDIFNERYYIINKRIMWYIGQWPYQPVFERTVRSTFLIVLALSLMVPQTLQLIQSWGDAASFSECFPPLVTNFGSDVKLLNFVFHSQKVRWLLDEVRADWECTRHLPELKILHEHGRKGMRFTIAYLTMIYATVAAWTSVLLIPIVMDVVAPLNESRPRIQYFATDYRVDPDKYFYPIFFHSFAVTVVALPIFVAVDTFFMMISQHACAKLNILRYRLENITRADNEDTVRIDTNIRDFYYRQIVACITTHKRAIEYIGVMQASCQWYLLLLVGLNMVSISCTCSQTVARDTSTADILRFAFFSVAQVFHLFCNTMPGQWISETSSLIPFSAYSCDWHSMSPKSRRLIVLFIRRSVEPCLITAGKMYVMSMENFCSVLKTSMSYMTLLSSTQ